MSSKERKQAARNKNRKTRAAHQGRGAAHSASARIAPAMCANTANAEAPEQEQAQTQEEPITNKKLRETLHIYLRSCTAERRLNEKTVKAYRCDIGQYLEWAERHRAQFGKEAMRSYLMSLNEHYAVSSVRRKLASLRAWCTWLRRETYIRVSPFKDLQISIRRPIVLPRTIGPADLRLMMGTESVGRPPHSVTECQEQRDIRDQAVLELLIATGARVSEVCSLDIESVDMEARIVRIHGKGSKERIVYLGSVHTIEALEGYLTVRLPNGSQQGRAAGEEHALFLNSSHARLGEQGVREIIRKRAREMGVTSRITPHMFRHTFATALLEQDVDIRYIQQLLGHSSIRTTERYAHATSARLRKIMEERNPRDAIEISN